MKRLLFFGLALSALAACKQDDDIVDPPEPTPLDLSSQYYTDINAQPAGSAGSPEDFQTETWEPWVRTLFAHLDTAALPGVAAISDDIERVTLFPNPAVSSQVMYVLGVDTVNVKLVLVDRNRTAVWKSTHTIQSSTPSSFLPLSYANAALGQDSLFRLYYAFSTQASPYFHTSHADVTLRH